METTMTEPCGIISLITDFGLSDEYVGVMKGVILRDCPTARIVDICHAVPPQNIIQAAGMLAASYPFFPAGTVHLTVVDPGVGTERHILIVEADGHLFIAPDNGILTPLLNSEKLSACFRLNVSREYRGSSTFHGRDIMAPAAALLAAGKSPGQLAVAAAKKKCVTIPMPSARAVGTNVTGEVVSIDHFGNIATSIRAEQLSSYRGALEIRLDRTAIRGLHETFGQVGAGCPVALVNSRGNLEIGINMGNAAKELGIAIGDTVLVRPYSKEQKLTK